MTTVGTHHNLDFVNDRNLADYRQKEVAAATESMTRAAARGLGHLMRWKMPRVSQLLVEESENTPGTIEVTQYVIDDHWLTAAEAWNVQYELHGSDRKTFVDEPVWAFLEYLHGICRCIDNVVLFGVVPFAMPELLAGSDFRSLAVDDLLGIDVQKVRA